MIVGHIEITLFSDVPRISWPFFEFFFEHPPPQTPWRRNTGSRSGRVENRIRYDVPVAGASTTAPRKRPGQSNFVDNFSWNGTRRSAARTRRSVTFETQTQPYGSLSVRAAATFAQECCYRVLRRPNWSRTTYVRAHTRARVIGIIIVSRWPSHFAREPTSPPDGHGTRFGCLSLVRPRVSRPGSHTYRYSSLRPRNAAVGGSGGWG